MKRAFDIIVSIIVLIGTSPFFLIAVVGILLSSKGAIFYRAMRVGQGGEPFAMYKFRSMHVSTGGSVITAANDTRVFGFGAFLRKSKIDELPQFLNVLRGDMSIIGPRPEDPKIVTDHYTDWMMKTLDVRPGISSPGAIYYYGYGEHLIDDADPEGSYVQNLLPPKLAVELAYLQRANFWSDLGVAIQTALAICKVIAGRPIRLPQRDLDGALNWVSAAQLQASR
ncbi:glycosyl transferase [Amylibacter ulvae]|uniref:Glycosyl transferase n=1 Tax=Paramylibacter ulvae TaxID=1651968 RepID=A0ABQ3D7W0_9RHOB|nr:sugar transferase [Amylibacter ulvae]GHA59092.1 glycosyl transferase [Amylibacter ulvae]